MIKQPMRNWMHFLVPGFLCRSRIAGMNWMQKRISTLQRS